jgi:hypothetical protein
MNIPISPPFIASSDKVIASVQTQFSIGFEALLTAYEEFVDAEVDLDFISHCDDPSVSFWTRDRDAAEKRLTERLAQLRQLSVRHPDDRPLHRFAVLLTRMLDLKDCSYPRQLWREMVSTFSTHYQVCGYGPRANYRNAMLAQALHMTNAMVRLSRFDFCPVSTPPEPVVDDLATFLAPDF